MNGRSTLNSIDFISVATRRLAVCLTAVAAAASDP